MPASDSSTSASLLERVRQFEPDAWERLTRLYSPLVYRWCRHARLQDNDAADVVQEVFRAVASGISQFQYDRPGDTFRGWLWTITKNKLRDHFRGFASRPGAVGGTDMHEQISQIPETIPDEDDGSDFDTSSSLVHRALELVRDEFEPRTWQAFFRMAVGGQRPAEIADDLDMSVGAVCTAKWRVLRRVREEMEGLL